MESQLELSIATLNVFGAPFFAYRILRTLFRTKIFDRFKIITKYFNKSNIDIVAFQEVHTNRQLSFLIRSMSAYPYVACEKYFFGPRGGVVIFSKFPFENVDYVDFKQKGKLWNKSIVGKIGKRGVLIAKLSRHPIYILNTHLTQNSDHNWHPKNRFLPIMRSQLQQLSEIVASLSEKNSVITTGDFNMPKTSPYYEYFKTQSRVKDIFADYSFNTYRKEFLPSGHSVGRIDYIFTSGKPEIIEPHVSHIFRKKLNLSKHGFHYVSDHVGLKARLLLNFS